MWYSNQLTIRMRNEEMAKEALEVLVKRLVPVVIMVHMRKVF